MKLNDDGLVWIVNIPKYTLAVLVKGACCEHGWNVRARQLDAVPPARNCGGVVSYTTNMSEWNVKLALERP